jgi:hypothetical protein
MIFNPKNIEINDLAAEQIVKHKFAIASNEKKLENYDLLSQEYLQLGQTATAKLLVNELKWEAFLKFSTFDSDLLFGLEHNPFDYTTALDLRLAFNTRIHQWEDFYENFSSYSLKKAQTHFLLMSEEWLGKIIPKTMSMSLFETLLNKINSDQIYDENDLFPMSKHALNRLQGLFDKNQIQFVDYKTELLQFGHILLKGIKDNRFPQDHKRILYLAFLTAILTCLKNSMGYQVIDNHLGGENLRIIQSLWQIEGESFVYLLERIWDTRRKQ